MYYLTIDWKFKETLDLLTPAQFIQFLPLTLHQGHNIRVGAGQVPFLKEPLPFPSPDGKDAGGAQRSRVADDKQSESRKLVKPTGNSEAPLFFLGSQRTLSMHFWLRVIFCRWDIFCFRFSTFHEQVGKFQKTVPHSGFC